jgi:hypothetical protein
MDLGYLLFTVEALFLLGDTNWITFGMDCLSNAVEYCT